MVVTFCCNDLTGRLRVSVKCRFFGNLKKRLKIDTPIYNFHKYAKVYLGLEDGV